MTKATQKEAKEKDKELKREGNDWVDIMCNCSDYCKKRWRVHGVRNDCYVTMH